MNYVRNAGVIINERSFIAAKQLARQHLEIIKCDKEESFNVKINNHMSRIKQKAENKKHQLYLFQKNPKRLKLFKQKLFY